MYFLADIGAWSLASRVTSGFALLAFLVVAAVISYRERLKQQERMIKSSSPGDRADLVARVLRSFKIDTENLTKQQQYDLAVKQLGHEAARHKMNVAAAIIILVCTVTAAIALTIVSSNGKNDGFQNQPPDGGRNEGLKSDATLTVERIYLAPEPAASSRYGSWRLIEQAPEGLEGPSHNKDRVSELRMSKAKIMRLIWQPKPEYDLAASASLESDEYKVQLTEKMVAEAMNFAKKSGRATNESTARVELMEYINSLIKPPSLRIAVRNTGDKAATVNGLSFSNVFSFGGDAGDGGALLTPLNKEFSARLTYETNSALQFTDPIKVASDDTVVLLLDPVVDDATQGDGPGSLCYDILIDFFDGTGPAKLLVQTLEQDDYVGLHLF